MLVDSAIRLEPSESTCVPPDSSPVRSPLLPYGSSELRDPPVLNAAKMWVKEIREKSEVGWGDKGMQVGLWDGDKASTMPNATPKSNKRN